MEFMMHPLATVLAAYVLGAGNFALLLRKVLRFKSSWALLVAFTFPIFIVAGLTFALYAQLTGRVIPASRCPDGLDHAEALIEQERFRMFGGQPQPHWIALATRLRFAREYEKAAGERAVEIASALHVA